MSDTLANLESRLMLALGLPEDDGMFPTADRVKLINQGLKAMATDYDWPWLQVDTTLVTADGDESYAPPAGWTRTLWLSDEVFDLELRQRRDLTQFLDSTIKGRPRLYAVYGEQIILAPVPDSVRTLRHGYIRSEPPLEDAGDTALCPTVYDDLIVFYAGQAAATLLKDTTLYQMFGAQIADQKRRISDNMRRSASTVRIRARREWG